MSLSDLPWTPELAKWLSGRPKDVQEVATKIHPLGVYRISGVDPGIYGRVASYGEGDESRSASVALICFAKDSLMPRWGMTGVNPGDLTLIGQVDPATGVMTFYSKETGEGTEQ